MKLVLLISLLVLSSYCAKPANFSSNTTVDGYTLKYAPDDEDNNKIWFEFSKENNGWIAIGLGTFAKMANMDIWKFTHDGTNVVATDQNVLGATAPSDDTTNDLTLDTAASSFSNNQWKVVFSRKFKTGDEKDHDLVCGQNNLTFALGADQANSVHTAYPVYGSIDLPEGDYGCGNYKNGSGSILVSSIALIALLVALII